MNLLLFRFKKCNSKSRSIFNTFLQNFESSWLETIVRKGMLIINTRRKAVEHRRKAEALVKGGADSKDSLFPPLPPWNLEGWLQVCVKTHEYALSTRLLNGGHVALKGHRIWAREVFFTKNQVNGARIHPIPSSSFPSPSPSTSFVLYYLFVTSHSLDFSFSFLPLYFTREESKKKKKSDNRDAYRVALFPFSHRERLTASSRWTTRNCASVHQGELCRALHVVLDRDGIDFRKASHCFSPRILSDFSLSLMHARADIR